MDSFDNIKRKNLLRTIYLAMCFVLLFTAYSSAQNLMTQIYHQLGYGSLGLICFFCIYASFALSSLVSAHYHKKLPFKAELVYASSTYVLFILSGALVTFCNKYELDSGFCHSSFIYSASIIAALILGVGASFLWLGQATYVNTCADEQSKGAFNGTFFSVFQFSQVISSLIATYVLGYADQFTFYVVLLAFATIATIMLSFIKAPVSYTNIVKGQQAIEPEESLKESVNTMFKTLKDQKYSFLFMAMIFSGIAPTFYSCSLGTIIASTVDSTNLNVVNQKTGMVFFVLAIAEVVAGGTIGYFADKYNKLKLLGVLIIVNEIALFAELTASGFKSYWFGMLSGLIWGFGETAINTIINVIIGSRFNGRLELFACLRSLQSFGAVTAVTCSIMFLQASPVICIVLVATILFVLQALFYHFYPREDSNESDYVRLKEEKIMVELKNM